MVFAVLVTAVVFTVLAPRFMSAGNLANIGSQISFLAILAVSMTFVIISGEIDLSIGSMGGAPRFATEGVVHQELSLFPSVTVLSNAYAGNEYRDRLGLLDEGASLSAEWQGRGIRVNVVVPGVLDTPFTGGDRANLERWSRERVPAGRPGDAAEVAELVRYVVLDAPDFLVGSRLVIDGGSEAVA